MISRRKFIFAGATLGTAALVSTPSLFNSAKITTEDLSLTKTEVFLATLPSAFEGFCIGMLADPHLGTCSNNYLLTRAVDLLMNEKIDLLVLAGDYILILDLFVSRFLYSRYSLSSFEKSCSSKKPSFSESLAIGEFYFKQVALEAARLNPTHGIVAVLGNHDNWNSGDNCSRIFNESGIEMLVNRSINISKGRQTLEIYGSDDYGTGVPKAPEGSNPARILISHNPDFLSELIDDNLFLLGLAGHTHGGQINLPLIGPQAFNIEDPRLIQGLIKISNSQIFVSTGIGISGMPWRINCPPEVNLITLRAGLTPNNTQVSA